jgi:hypothetical protein
LGTKGHQGNFHGHPPGSYCLSDLPPWRRQAHLSIIQTKQIKGKPKVDLPRQNLLSILSSSIGTPEAVFTSIGDTETLNYFSLIGGQEGEKWMEARDKEICSLEKKHCWVAVDLHPNTPSVGSKYICKLKLNPNGSIAKYKVRLVAQGFTQVEGINFYDTYSPVAKLSSIRTVIALASINKMHLHHIERKSLKATQEHLWAKVSRAKLVPLHLLTLT